MPLDLDQLLEPISADEPFGPELRYETAFQQVRDALAQADAAPSAGPIRWSEHRPSILELCERGRDLRVWVWLTRLDLASEGIAGLADGLELIVAGLDRHWDDLPPIDLESQDPSERFAERINAFLPLGATHNRYQDPHDVPPDGQAASGSAAAKRTTPRLRLLNDEMQATLARGEAGLPAQVARALAALDRIEALFRDRMPGREDPQLGFEFLRGRLTGAAGGPAVNGDARSHTTPTMAEGLASGPVRSRSEVVRALDLVLDYYRTNEPASPVPLLVARAKRLVNMSFLDAIKELAPSGLKELQGIAGRVDDGKAEVKAG
jgi:type VI secretion system protein ImpA